MKKVSYFLFRAFNIVILAILTMSKIFLYIKIYLYVSSDRNIAFKAILEHRGRKKVNKVITHGLHYLRTVSVIRLVFLVFGQTPLKLLLTVLFTVFSQYFA